MITNNILECISVLEAEDLLGFPTETVYGLGARADSSVAVNKIFKAKNRPKNHPLIVHGSNTKSVFECVENIPDYAYVLAENFWPGPMSLILPKKNNTIVCDEVTGGLDSIAVRVPKHDIALKLFSKCDFLVAGPSANIFSHVSPTSAEHVISEFTDRLTVLDGGDCNVGVESTIISCLGDTPKILRSGYITDIEISKLLDLDQAQISDIDISNIKVSGNLKIHYSPRIPVYRFENIEDLELRLENTNHRNLAYIGFNKFINNSISFSQIINSNEEFAHKLYSFFRHAQDKGCSGILVIAPSNIGLGVAINDRLSKASSDWTE
ncbi:MAG: threonylcarbamoyl-AMP synthase [Acidimicrobiia bacterium]|nr:threonylcarbamoyl-AMP synthase [Acidimicrobiia bacterium]